MSTKPIVVFQEKSSVPYKGSPSGVGYKISTKVEHNPGYDGLEHVKVLYNPFVKRVDNGNFVRYATIADLTLLLTDRFQAQSSNEAEFLDSAFDIIFDNLNVAVNAAEIINDAINNLVTVYLELHDKFIGSSEVALPYPAEVDTLRDQYINAYKAARQSRESSESAQAASQTSYTIAENKKSVLAQSKTDICDISSKLTAIATSIPSIIGQYQTTLLNLIDQYKQDPNSGYLENAHASALNALITWLSGEPVGIDSTWSGVTTASGLTVYADIISLNVQATGLCSSYTSQLATSETQLNSALSQLKNSVTSKEVSAALEQKSLAELATYCPDLDPTSVT